MAASLHLIELDNFKSYREKVTVGPLKNFTAIIGPNGSGKSNFMDAISFVMGEKTSALRVKRLSDLIHGASVGKPVARSASVTAVFKLNDGVDKRFTRSIQGSSSDFKVDGTAVSTQAYLAELEKLRINVKAKNFLVFQGAIESIAMKNPKERTALFEEISGSGALKDEYDRLKKEVKTSEEETNLMYLKKRGIQSEHKGAKKEKIEAEKFQKDKAELAEKEVEYQLFRLYRNERDVKKILSELKKGKDGFAKREKEKDKAEEILKEKKKEQGKASRDLAKTEQDIREMEVEMSKKQPAFIKLKERIGHIEKNIKNAEKSLNDSKSAHEAHEEDIAELEREMREVENEKLEYERQVEGESMSQGRDVHLEDAQATEYKRLKDEAVKQSAAILQELVSINREQKSDQDKLDNALREKNHLLSKIKKKNLKKEESERRMEKLNEFISCCTSSLEEKRKLSNNTDVKTLEETVEKLTKELENVNMELSDVRVDKQVMSRQNQAQHVLRRLQDAFNPVAVNEGDRVEMKVHGRLVDLIHPTHPRYHVAVTKVLGKYMDAIVVDTEATARECIKYLKTYFLSPETFLPIDYIRVKPLKEELRNIKNPKNVKMLFDVLIEDTPSDRPIRGLRQVLLFVTRNILVCDTPDDARLLAYDPKKPKNCVALDGTFFQKNGLFSGGQADLTQKAKRWTSKEYENERALKEKKCANLKATKEKLHGDLRQAMKKAREGGSEGETVKKQIEALEYRIRYAEIDRQKMLAKIQKWDGKITNLKASLDRIVPSIPEMESSLREKDTKIQDLKDQINSVEDRVFADFCQQVGIENIRQYEERELPMQLERTKKRLEFDNLVSRIKSQLEYENSKDFTANISRWEKALDDLNDELRAAKKAQQKQLADIDKDTKELESLKATKLTKKQIVDAIGDEVSKACKELNAKMKELKTAEKQVSLCESKLEAKKNERHDILMYCKVENITIPMHKGSMQDVAQDSQDSEHEREQESGIEIDYSSLNYNLRLLEDAEDIRKKNEELSGAINDLAKKLGKAHAPNLRAAQKFNATKAKAEQTIQEFENARERARQAKLNFERVKRDRHNKFMACFDHVSNEIDALYKTLTMNESAQSFLGPDNPEEPYLEGINYNCVAPGKRFMPMSNLSGGEKTIAALALLFAIHSFQPAPFFVLDEIDAALDNTNIAKVASYIRQKTPSLQTFVISLKEEFFSHADALIGVSSEVDKCLVSKILTLDLTAYPKHWT